MKRVIVFFLLILLTYVNVQTTFAQFSSKLEGKEYPWTKEPSITSENYRFLVVGDLTGGEIEGMFEKFIPRINELDADFIISMGDLIEGYTNSATLIYEQWDRFNSSINKLNAPFFYVPGNHDILGSASKNIWKEKYGNDYYAFNIGDAKYLVLNMWEIDDSDDISDNQAAYFIKEIKNHPKDAPLFIFTHSPFYERENEANYAKIDELLTNREVVFFSGHAHTYLYNEFNKHKHYRLAGIATLPLNRVKPNLGEFFNLMLVSVRGDKVSVSNINAEGLLPTDIVNSETEYMVSSLRNSTWLNIKPVITDFDTQKEIKSYIELDNSAAYSMSVSGELLETSTYSISPKNINVEVPAGEKNKLPITLTFKNKSKMTDEDPIFITLEAKYDYGKIELSSDASKRFVVDSKKYCKDISKNAEQIICDFPEYVDESWCWNGAKDGMFTFSVKYDSDNIIIDIKTEDDVLLLKAKDDKVVEDKILVDFISGDDQVYNVECAYNGNMEQGKCVVDGNSLKATIFIPKSKVKDNKFRLNIGFVDNDDLNSTDPSVLWWKPKFGSDNDYNLAGYFEIL